MKHFHDNTTKGRASPESSAEHCAKCVWIGECPFPELITAAETGGAPTAVIKHYRAKQVVVEQGEPVTWLCVVCEGIVAVNFLDETGKEGAVHLTGPTGMLVPTDFFLGRLVHVMSAVTLSKVTVAFIKPQSLWERIERDQVFAGRLLRRLAEQMGVLEQRYARLQTQNARTRSIQIILEMVRLLGQENLQRVALPIGLTRSVMAQLIGNTPETVSRVMTQLKRDGLLKISDSHLIIPNLQALRNALRTK